MSGNSFRICFFGTPLFAVPSLERLCGEPGISIAAVVTQQDKPAGRGRHEQPPPVKECALRLGLEGLLHQPQSVNTPEFCAAMRALEPDLFIVIAFGQIFKPEILAVPRRGSVNAHASLLPRYRGAAPIQAALMNGDATTGTSTIFMNERMDAGNVIIEDRLAVEDADTSLTLARRLADQSADLLARTVAKLIAEPGFAGTPQDEALATFTRKITRETARIDWSQPATEIHNLVRAMNPSPGAFGFIDTKSGRKSLKILRTAVAPRPAGGAAPGTIISAGQEGILAAAGRDCLLIKTLQIEGAKAMDAEVFLRGHPLEAGVRIENS